jgi:hypothetical protein
MTSKPCGSILFIGNSYTNDIQTVFKQLLAKSYYSECSVDHVWGGGITLGELLSNGRAIKKLDQRDWDVVVLQEQSQLPALPEKHAIEFHNAVDNLVKEIKKRGAKPILYMTWGRRDADSEYEKLFNNYEVMQEKLTAAYINAAKRNDVQIAPVGEIWSKIRGQNDTLGRELYQNDGSHPSVKGAYLASCVFIHELFGDDLSTIVDHEEMIRDECNLIKKAILSN